MNLEAECANCHRTPQECICLSHAEKMEFPAEFPGDIPPAITWADLLLGAFGKIENYPNLEPRTFANYKYSLSAAQQRAIQIFLRLLPRKLQESEVWKLLHDLTYSTERWSQEPMFSTVGNESSPNLDNSNFPNTHD